MPKCSRCHRSKSAKHFSTSRARGKWCHHCYLRYYKEYNKTRIDERDGKERYEQTIRAHRLANKAALVRALGGACSICGYNRSLAALDFDHVTEDGSPFPSRGERNNRKEASVSVLLARMTLQGFDMAVEEAKKCALVCANCHRERTFPGLSLGAPESLEDARARLARRKAEAKPRRPSSGSPARRALGERLSRPVERVDPATGEVTRYESGEATRRDGFNPSSVSKVARGQGKSHGGYHWRWEKT